MSALPSQSRYIIGTEACERFSFYGMKSILMLYMTGHLLTVSYTHLTLPTT